jgi:hypothetical protein
MKNKITCLLAGAALFGATANAEIVLTDSLSAYGYIDMALVDDEGKGNTETGVAEFELGFAFTPAESKWSAVAELSFDSDTADDDGTSLVGTDDEDSSAEFETVTISYQYSDTLSFTFGNILSYQGFETYDATGLYQFSYAGPGGAAGSPLYSAAYAVGASADGSLGDFDYGVWIGDSSGPKQATNSFEYLVAYNGIENLTIKAIIADDPYYDTENIWASYDYGDFTFAVEYVATDYTDNDGSYEYNDNALYSSSAVEEYDATVFMVYKAFGNAGLTLRYTDATVKVGGEDIEYEKTTISPSYAFSDNVFGLIEFSQEELSAAGAPDQDSAAVELIYSF